MQNTLFVPLTAQVGYTMHYDEAAYYRQLDAYRLPGFEQGDFRAFEGSGGSMTPTINHRDVVVGSRAAELRLLTASVMLKRIQDRPPY